MPRISPVILIVEDEFLLRMDSAELIENAGFEVFQAGNADEAIEILKARSGIHVVFTDIPDAGLDGRAQARPVRPEPLAADQDRCDVSSFAGRRRRFAGRQRIFAEAIPWHRGSRNAATINRHGLIKGISRLRRETSQWYFERQGKPVARPISGNRPTHASQRSLFKDSPETFARNFIS
jgi:CheY-like chemotaxis protein